MTNLIIQGVRAAGPTVARMAGRAALAYANVAISNLLNPRTIEGPRLESFHIQTSRDGAPMARVFGRARLAGQVIWASQIKESQTDEQISGKGGGPTLRNYSYSMSFAVGLCEGEISGIGRIWANGVLIPSADIHMRVHKGAEDQNPDPLIQMIDGPDVPAHRGTAYIVFEDFALDDYGARLPQLNIEVFRRTKGSADRPQLERLVRGVNLIPGSGEFVYSPKAIEEQIKAGQSRAVNVNNVQSKPDIIAALDQLEDQLPECKSVSIVVSWFGTDLRLDHCTLSPGIETRERVTTPDIWSVGGKDRASSTLISRRDGSPVYGGTPSDQSVVDLIKELRRRGMAVSLYPFILMDIDPALGQPDFPWRGRITSPHDGSAQAEQDVAQFFGQCRAEDFTVQGEAVIYDGPQEDSFRRMILHYAALAKAAGGVDSFVIGSEMRGLTTVRGASDNYIAVDALMELTADVRSILGAQTGLTYAADWSEYFGHHSGGNVRFHLDPLWAHPAIDAIGIDAYFPLADWRGDDGHIDASLARDSYDGNYLSGNIEGGEGFDWYYASDEDRTEQIRTPITDGAYNEPWIYRYKDLRSFWSQPHYNRTGGVRDAAPTPWQPQSKPIWLTEIGCPAIQYGANQPNVFWDPKSSESFAPYFSDARRDDLIQRRYLESFIHYWEQSAGNNPISDVYGGPMIDPDYMHVWCWDARPFPDFPAREDVWSDGPNWRRGHWLNGRVGAALLPDIVSEIVEGSAAGAPDISALSGLVTGYVLERPMSARSALEGLSQLFGFDVIEGAGQLIFQNTNSSAVIDIDSNAIAARESGAAITRGFPDADLTPKDIRVHYLDDNYDYQLGMVSTHNDQEGAQGVIDISAAVVMDAGQAGQIGVDILRRVQQGAESLSLTLMPSQLNVTPSDIIRVSGQDGLWQVQTLEGHSARRMTARRFIGYGLDLSRGAEVNIGASPAPALASAPDIIMLDIPSLNGTSRTGALVGVYARPFAATEVSFDGNFASLARSIASGVTLSDLPRGPVGRSHAIDLIIEIENAALSDLLRIDFLRGQQSFALQTPQGWEIVQAQYAALIAPNTYRLCGLLRGVSGSEHAIVDTLGAGAQIVRLDARFAELSVSSDWRGAEITLSAQTVGRSAAQTLTAPYAARHLTPLAPVHGRIQRGADGKLTLSWIRQSRLSTHDWTDPPLGEASERYSIRVLDGDALIVEREATQPRYTFTAAESALIGADAIFEVRQLSAEVGEGDVLVV